MGTMALDDEDLEEELRRLDIQEDLGEEDSDVTPTNTPPVSPPTLYCKKYPNIVQCPPRGDLRHFERSSRSSEYDSRSDSSLSWGDDEFEGEATRQVTALFDQLDLLLYEEETTQLFSNLKPSILKNGALSASKSLHVPIYEQGLHVEVSKRDIWLKDKPFNEQEVFGTHFYGDEETDTKESVVFSELKVPYSPPVQLEDEVFQEEDFEHTADAPAPSLEFREECETWVQHFPHFRARGSQIDPHQYTRLEQLMFSNDELNLNIEDYDNEEELITSNGDYYHLLPYVSMTRLCKEKTVKVENSVNSSRVCSGSSDPDVLKEQVLIMLFDKVWPQVTNVLSPLLHKYAKYVIKQSVQLSSLSREPSTKGERLGFVGPTHFPKKSSEVYKKDSKFALPPTLNDRPISGVIRKGYRPLSAITRPASALNRLQTVNIPQLCEEELCELLQVSPKPLQNGDERLEKLRLRTPSASKMRNLSTSSSISLPEVVTSQQLQSLRRPASSMTANHLMNPKRSNSLVSLVDQRPSSTSSSHSRNRFQERFQNLSRHRTIQEVGDAYLMDDDEYVASDIISPGWSRHVSFLPPISDSGSPLKNPLSTLGKLSAESTHPALSVRATHPVLSVRATHPALSVRGTSFSARHRPLAPQSKAQQIRTKMVQEMRPVEPFVSWVAEQANEDSGPVREPPNICVKNSLVIENNRTMNIMDTKHSRRYSHH